MRIKCPVNLHEQGDIIDVEFEGSVKEFKFFIKNTLQFKHAVHKLAKDTEEVNR